MNAFIVIGTLILADIAMSLAQEWFPSLGRYVEGLPVVHRQRREGSNVT